MRKILLLIPQNVIPPNDGGKTGIYMPMQMLAKKYAVKAVIFCSAGEGFNASDYEALDVEAIAAEVNKKDSPITLLANILSHQPFKFSKYYKRRHLYLIKKICRKWQPDIIICHHAHLAEYCRQLKKISPKTQLILREHNVEYLLVQQYYKLQQNIFLKNISYWQYQKTKRYERKCWAWFDNVVFISDSDFKQFDSATNTKACVIYDGPGNNWSQRNAAIKKNAFLFTGNVSSYQNKKNLENFIRKVWIPWKQQQPASAGFELWITGNKSYDQVLNALQLNTKQATELQIKILGFVDDLAAVIAESRFFLSPTLIGAGIRIKVLEAMREGACVFLTMKDLEMCGVLKDRENVLVYSDTDSFNSQFTLMQQNAALYNHITVNAQNTAIDNFSWSIFFEKLQLLFINNG
ncbi:MAG TPA: glycosyltransferase [Chitinophagaceae bacterium]|nr:glycosyltransferase [Chitinophagaceae bacterium]